MVQFMTCVLDSRQFPCIRDVIQTIKRVAKSAHDEGVIFLLSLPEEHVKLWRAVLSKTFSKEEGYVVEDPGVDAKSGAALREAVIHFGMMKPYVQVLRTPEASGCAEFGERMIYVELPLSEEASARSVGILWAFDLFCVDKPYFDDGDYSEVIVRIREQVARQRFQSLCDRAAVDCAEALERVRKHLAGIVLITDMRSSHFNARYPIHQWKMCGIVHVVQGTVVDGKFKDTYSDGGVGMLPVCYQIRSRKRYWVPNHSIDFWSDKATGEELPPATTGCAGAATAEPGANSSGLEMPTVKGEVEPECMVCLSRTPTCVFETCGHLGVCGHCRQWMLKAQNQCNQCKGTGAQVPPAKLKMAKVKHLKTSCPYCRALSRIVPCSNHTGAIYVV